MLKEDNDDEEAIQKMGKEIEKRLDRNLVCGHKNIFFYNHYIYNVKLIDNFF